MRTAAAILVSLPVSFLGFVIGPTASARTPSEYKQEPWTTCEKATRGRDRRLHGDHRQ
jgi:hypothetical protein